MPGEKKEESVYFLFRDYQWLLRFIFQFGFELSFLKSCLKPPGCGHYSGDTLYTV